MSKSGRIALVAALLIVFATAAIAQVKKETPRNYGIGHVATPGQLAGWDIDVRPDGQGRAVGRCRMAKRSTWINAPHARRVRRERGTLAAARTRQRHTCLA